MSSLFSMDGPLYRFGTWVVNVFLLNTLWILFSLPIITVGASTTAVFYIANQWVRGEEPRIIQAFWKSFTQNFRQATIIWIVIGLLGYVLLVNLHALPFFGEWRSIIYLLQLIALVELVLVSVYVFSLLSRFHVTVLDCLRSSFLMANRHFFTSMSSLVTLIALLWILYYVPALVFFAVSLYAVWVAFLQVGVFAQYGGAE